MSSVTYQDGGPVNAGDRVEFTEDKKRLEGVVVEVGNQGGTGVAVQLASGEYRALAPERLRKVD